MTPKLSTRSTTLFLSILSALLLYFFTFGVVAHDVHEAELVIECVRAMAGELKDIIVQAASEGTPIKTNFLLFLGGFDYRLEDRTKDGWWEFVPNLHYRWMIFSHCFLGRCERILVMVMAGFTWVSFSFLTLSFIHLGFDNSMIAICKGGSRFGNAIYYDIGMVS